MTAAHAQYGPDRDDRRSYGDYRSSFYDRLESDLSRAAHNGYLRGGDWDRFRKAQKEINEFQDKWSRGRYDKHELDDAIAATQRVVDIRTLNARDRDAIQDDLARMRAFRERMNHR